MTLTQEDNITAAANEQKLEEHLAILESQLIYTLKNQKPSMASLVREGQHREAAVVGKSIAHILKVMKSAR
jgi:hypothetical protein